MKIIKLLSEDIEQELDDAEKYAKLAIQYKEEYPEVARVFYGLSSVRMDGIKELHDQVVSLINNYKVVNGDPPAPMMSIYEYLHERHINQSVGVKKLQEMFKTNK